MIVKFYLNSWSETGKGESIVARGGHGGSTIQHWLYLL
jgi:hypothetical protein